MNFTNEQLTKAKAAKSVEELLAFAKENGTELTEDEAKKYFAELHKEGEIADDELANVAGGCGEDPHDAWHGPNGGFSNVVSDNRCPVCGEEMTWTGSVILNGAHCEIYTCGASGVSFEKWFESKTTWTWSKSI